MKHRLIILIIQFLMSSIGLTQSTRGVVQESDENINIQKGNTYALVIGISDYMGVQPLQFADQDALLFYQFLQSNAGGNVPSQNIKLLINEEATAGSIMTRGISWLQNTVQPKPGDRVYFYFAGHGDAVDASEAYLLAYDAQPAGDKNNYSVSGTINIQVLKNRIRKLTQSEVEVIFIVDACRTADIPGGTEGLKGNYQSIMENPSGDIMLLSASPNEVSFEDNTFGNGHGLFTWELINGLAGAADQDQDQNISLFEIETYVKSKVRNASKKLGGLQNPVICCSHQTEIIISKEDKKWLQEIQQDLPQGADVFAAQLAQARGGNDLFSFINDEVKKAYFDIKKYCNLQSEIGFQVADSIYNHVASKYKKEDIEFVSSYYSSALLDECQRALNKELNSNESTTLFDPCTYYHIHYQFFKKYMSIRGADQISDELKFKGTLLKSLRLSDEKAEVMKLYVQNDQYIFYRWDDINIKASPDTAFQYICQNVLSFLPSSKPSAVGYYNVAKILMGRRQLAGDQSQNDSILKYLQIAQTLAPNWTSPYRYLKYELLASGDTARAELFAEKEFELSSSKNKYINISKFYFYSSSNEWQKGISWLKKGIENASQPDVKREHYMALCRAYMNTSKCDSAMYLLQEMEQSIQVKPQKGSIYNVFNCQLEYNQNDLKALRKWIISQNWELNTMPYFASYLLFFGNHLKDSKNTENGKQIFTSLDDSCKVECLKLLSQHYILIHDFNNAEKNLLLAKEMKPNNRTIAYDIFKLYEKINDTLKVISSLKKLIAIDSLNGRHFIELAKYEILMGNNASAQLLIEKAEQLSSRGDYLIRIAKTYRHLGNEEKFNEISRKALQSGYEEKKDKYYTLIFDDDSYLVSYTKPCR